MRELSEFFCRVNCNMVCGNFEFDWNNGQICYKCYVDFEERNTLTQGMQFEIFFPSTQLETYSNSILRIMFGGLSAKDAFDMCEE